MALRLVSSKEFANGRVFALETHDSYPVEVTDTFLPLYTRDAVGQRTNAVKGSKKYGSRKERWMIGVSVMSGCPVGCAFCATGQMKRWRALTAHEIIEQIEFVLRHTVANPTDCAALKINFTRMGEPFLNINAVRDVITWCRRCLTMKTELYVSTIGIRGADYSWIDGEITLQISLHALTDERRNALISYKNKVAIQDLGVIRTDSNRKTTLNLTLVERGDFDINVLQKYFSPDAFFVKLSPVNANAVSEAAGIGTGIVEV